MFTRQFDAFPPDAPHMFARQQRRSGGPQVISDGDRSDDGSIDSDDVNAILDGKVPEPVVLPRYVPALAEPWRGSDNLVLILGRLQPTEDAAATSLILLLSTQFVGALFRVKKRCGSCFSCQSVGGTL